MTYQVLARAWRPQKFDDLLGQEAVVTTLCNALAGGTLGHAYLFTGLRGVGKTTAARLLAKAVNCVEGPTPRPCGACPSCLEVAAGASLDVVELDAATHTGVDDVRDLQELLRYRPVRDRYRVLIVDEVHMLSRAAFNALLKTVEEPPPYILWVLATTERHKVPATILSRCQQLEFRPLAADLIAAHLGRIAEREGFQLAPAAAGVIARSARGSVRDALSLLDQLRAFASDRVDEAAVAEVLGVPRLERLEELVRAAVAGDGAAMLGLLRSELTAGRDPSVLYHETGRLLKSLLHLAVDPELEADLVAEQRERMLGLARQIGSPALTRRACCATPRAASWPSRWRCCAWRAGRRCARSRRCSTARRRLRRRPAARVAAGRGATPVASARPARRVLPPRSRRSCGTTVRGSQRRLGRLKSSARAPRRKPRSTSAPRPWPTRRCSRR